MHSMRSLGYVIPPEPSQWSLLRHRALLLEVEMPELARQRLIFVGKRGYDGMHGQRM